MPIELAGITLSKINKITTLEHANIVRHQVPGMEGEISQNLGRRSVRLQIEGSFYGEEAQEGIDNLRKVHKDREPVELLADIIGKTYFAQVILDLFEVKQDALEPDQFSFLAVITEYVVPPQPAIIDLPDVDTGILQEAQQFIQIVQLPDLIQLPDIKDPTTPMKGMLLGVENTLNPLEDEHETLTEIFGEE